MTRVLITATPPTPNGDLHVGHLSGPYLRADIYARYRRMRGDDVLFICSADDHQSYLVRKAEALGMSPEAAARKFTDEIEDTLQRSLISLDAFTRPRESKYHFDTVRSFFGDLLAKGIIDHVSWPTFFCEPCGGALTDFDVIGSCGNCGAACDGGLCEECGRLIDTTTLRQPLCGRCSTRPSVRPVERLALRTSMVQDELDTFYSTRRAGPRPTALWEALRSSGLPDIPITVSTDWGIPVNDARVPGQSWWVWAEMAPGYVATTKSCLDAAQKDVEGWVDYWCDLATDVVQFFGFDNSPFQMLVHTALFAAHDEYRLPDRFVVNEFYRLNGAKFSSSRAHAVWGQDILRRVNPDALRWYTALTGPEDRQTNFTLAEFQSTVNSWLAGRVNERLVDLFAAAAPGQGGASAAQAEAVVQPFADRLAQTLTAETFSAKTAIGVWDELVAALAVEMRAGGLDAPAVGAALTVLAGCTQPLMPGIAGSMWSALGAPGDVGAVGWGKAAPQWVPRPRGSPWFAAIEDQQISGLGPSPT